MEFRGIGRRSSDWLQKMFLLPCGCQNSISLPRGAVGWSVVCDCGIFGHTHLPFGSVFWDSSSQWLGLFCTCYENPLFGTVAYIAVNRPLLAQWHTISQLALLKSQQEYSFNSGQKAISMVLIRLHIHVYTF